MQTFSRRMDNAAHNYKQIKIDKKKEKTKQKKLAAMKKEEAKKKWLR